eukprot:642353-Hanusia_phi.AAC.6
MISGSTDKTLIVWKNADGREMMLYPFYVKLRVFDMKVWPNALLFLSTRMNQGELYIGDSEGEIQKLKFDSEAREGIVDGSPGKFHSKKTGHQEILLGDDLGILHIWNWITENKIYMDKIYVQGPSKVESFYIARGIKHVSLKGHEGPLIGIGYLPPGKVKETFFVAKISQEQ